MELQMINKKMSRLMAGLALAASAALVPMMAGQAHDGTHKFDEKWGEDLAKMIEARVSHGLAKGAAGMEKGADKMLKGADKMEAYANRLEKDPEFRAREAAKQKKWGNGHMSADQLLEKASEFRRAAEEMREGAAEMREAAEDMRRGDAG